MPRVVRDGKVAVLISPGYGAGWSSWNSDHEEVMLFHERLVTMVEEGVADPDVFKNALTDIVGEDHVCVLGLDQLKIMWVPEGARFRVDEYDGWESIVFSDSEEWVTA